MIDAENLTKYYGRRAAVRDVTFHVEKGEIVGLLGPNGAGKTTTMRMLTGYLPASSGKATVAGYDVSDKPMEVRKRLGYLPETVPLYTDMTVSSYLSFIAKLRGVPPKARRNRIEEVMAMCRIVEVSNRVIGKLSRGYRQRVGLAQAIVHNPDVIILDEPTVGLDPRQIIETRNVIRDLAGSHSMILSTHILPEVSTLCDRVIIINRGRVLVDDSLENLQQQSMDNSRLQLLVRGPQTEIEAVLAQLPDVVKVGLINEEGQPLETSAAGGAQPEISRFTVEAQTAQDIRELVANTVIGQGWGLLELRNNAPSLEDIFVKLISSDVVEDDEVELATPLMDYGDTPDEEAVGRRRRFQADDDELDELEDVGGAETVTASADELDETPIEVAAPVKPGKASRKSAVKAVPNFLNEDEQR